MNYSIALGWLRDGLLLTQVKHELQSCCLLCLPFHTLGLLDLVFYFVSPLILSLSRKLRSVYQFPYPHRPKLQAFISRSLNLSH